MEFNNVWRSVEHSNETIKITWRFWHFHESSSKSQYYLKKEKKIKEKKTKTKCKYIEFITRIGSIEILDINHKFVTFNQSILSKRNLPWLFVVAWFLFRLLWFGTFGCTGRGSETHLLIFRLNIDQSNEPKCISIILIVLAFSANRNGPLASFNSYQIVFFHFASFCVYMSTVLSSSINGAFFSNFIIL